MGTRSKLIKISLPVGFLVASLLIHYQRQMTQDSNLANSLDLKANPTTPISKISYQETIYDFGVLDQGAMAKHEFTFTNLGTVPLIIYEVIPSCNLCTTVTWTQGPIQPGDKGTIEVKFNSAGRQGRQGKYLIVRANTEPSETRLLIRGTVKLKL
jgi:hypothetical protein